MKILVVCGHGLGSSFMVEMNVKQVLSEIDTSATGDIEVDHSDLSSASAGMADIFICGRDLADNLAGLGDLIVLDNILDKVELKTKLEQKLG